MHIHTITKYFSTSQLKFVIRLKDNNGNVTYAVIEK